jgi:chemotaxis protein CheD
MTSTARVTMVRIGEQSATATEGDVLSSVGLGSCIGLALVDDKRGVIGLAHILLPDSRAGAGTVVGKFADTAVPALVERMVRLGAVKRGLEAVLVGGAQMFAFGAKSTLDIGARNEEATRNALQTQGIPIRAAATAGNKGRTVTVYASHRAVTAKEAGGRETPLLGRLS